MPGQQKIFAIALLPLLLFSGIGPLVRIFRCQQDGSVHFSKCCPDTSDDSVAAVGTQCCDLISAAAPLVPAELVHASDLGVSASAIFTMIPVTQAPVTNVGPAYGYSRPEPRAGPPIVLLKRSFLI